MKIKQYIKIAGCCFLIIISSLMFSGCSAVNYTTIKNENGKITEIVRATIDETDIANEGYNVATKKEEICLLAKSTLQTKLSDYQIEVNTQKNMYHYQGNQEMENMYASLLVSVFISEPVWEQNVFICKIEFKSSSSYYLFYDITESNFKQEKTKNGLFTNKTYFRGNLGYSINNGLYATLSTSISGMFSRFSTDDCNLSYSYCAPSKRYHSNADTVVYTRDGYIHTWDVNNENINEEIYFYLILANRYAWYLLAIVISLIITVILCLIAIISNSAHKIHLKKIAMKMTLVQKSIYKNSNNNE